MCRSEDLTNVPQLAAYLKYLKPKRFTLKGRKTTCVRYLIYQWCIQKIFAYVINMIFFVLRFEFIQTVENSMIQLRALSESIC